MAEVVLLTVAGLQVPETPLIEVVGRSGAVALGHIGAMTLNIGMTLGLTVTVNVVVDAHCPASGVNV